MGWLLCFHSLVAQSIQINFSPKRIACGLFYWFQGSHRSLVIHWYQVPLMDQYAAYVNCLDEEPRYVWQIILHYYCKWQLASLSFHQEIYLGRFLNRYLILPWYRRSCRDSLLVPYTCLQISYHTSFKLFLPLSLGLRLCECLLRNCFLWNSLLFYP